MSTAIIISTLDEIDGVRQIMPQIKREWAETIVFVDGGSTDGTVNWYRFNRIRLCFVF